MVESKAFQTIVKDGTKILDILTEERQRRLKTTTELSDLEAVIQKEREIVEKSLEDLKSSNSNQIEKVTGELQKSLIEEKAKVMELKSENDKLKLTDIDHEKDWSGLCDRLINENEVLKKESKSLKDLNS